MASPFRFFQVEIVWNEDGDSLAFTTLLTEDEQKAVEKNLEYIFKNGHAKHVSFREVHLLSYEKAQDQILACLDEV